MTKSHLPRGTIHNSVSSSCANFFHSTRLDHINLTYARNRHRRAVERGACGDACKQAFRQAPIKQEGGDWLNHHHHNHFTRTGRPSSSCRSGGQLGPSRRPRLRRCCSCWAPSRPPIQQALSSLAASTSVGRARSCLPCPMLLLRRLERRGGRLPMGISHQIHCCCLGKLGHGSQLKGAGRPSIDHPSPTALCSGRGGATTTTTSTAAGGRRGVTGWLRSLAPGPDADPKRRLDWEFIKIAAPGTYVSIKMKADSHLACLPALLCRQLGT
jgi:hypothetical protein